MACALRYSCLSFVFFINDLNPFLCPMVSFSLEGILTKVLVLDMYKALSIHKIRQRYRHYTRHYTYIMHFDKDKIPPVKGFWSITMYNSKDYFVDNSINRYAIGDRTPGLK